MAIAEYRRVDGVPDEFAFQVIRFEEGWITGLQDHQIAETIVDQVAFCDNYHWVLKSVGQPTLNRRVHFTAYCCQDTSIQGQIPRDQLRRYHDRMDTYDCEGALYGVVNRDQNVMELTVRHYRLHPLPNDDDCGRIPTSQEARAFIAEQANQCIDASETYRRLLHHLPDEYVSRARVGYWWQQTFRGLWQMHEDQLQSCRLLV